MAAAAAATTAAASTSDAKGIKYLTQTEAINVDVQLFKSYAFSVDQLMELAGLSVASAVERYYNIATSKRRVLVICGPGNNGGDGLVAARHLSHFGFTVTIVYPKPPKIDLYKNLLTQAKNVGVSVTDKMPATIVGSFDVILDAIFGYSFTGDIRAPYDAIIAQLIALPAGAVPVVAVDIPSGWNVETGPHKPPAAGTAAAATAASKEADVKNSLQAEMLISLTAPKLCAAHFRGKYHVLGGRFVPAQMIKEFDLRLPPYHGADQFVLL